MTLPIGGTFNAAIQLAIQGGRLSVETGLVVVPFYECCVSGNTVGVDKAPVGRGMVYPLQLCRNQTCYIDYSNAYSPIGNALTNYNISWGDGNVDAGGWPGPGIHNNVYVNAGVWRIRYMIRDNAAYDSYQDFYVRVIDCVTYPVRTIVAVVNNEGIYRTVDGGLNWTKVLDAPANAAYSICADPFTYTHTQRIVFAALYTDGLWKSVDSGLTWSRTSFIFPPTCIKFSKVVQGKMYVLCVVGGDVWLGRSADGGATWVYLNTGDTPVHGIRQRELAVAFNDRYVFFIVDGGAVNELHRVDEDLMNRVLVYSYPGLSAGVVVTAQDDRVYSMATDGLRMSEDWGTTWTQILVTTGVRDLRVSKRDPKHIVAIFISGGNYYSNVSYDRGNTWTDLGIVADARCISIDRWDENLLYIGKSAGAGNQFMISPWNGFDPFARDNGLPAEQVWDMEVLA